jgi:hypothetical protein
MNLLTLPSLCLFVAPIGSGKTTLIKYLALSYADKIKSVKIYSNSGADAYEENYSWVNKKYVSDSFDEENWKNFLQLAKRIKKNDPEAINLLIFDDCIGMAKNLFKSQDAKRLITTLRFYNITLIISVQQIQSEVSTLIRNNLRDLFVFQQSDDHGVKVLYESYGKGSQNLNNKTEFETKMLNLEKFHFLHWNRNTRTINEHMVPKDLPDFRLYLHREDKECGKQLICEDRKLYNLSKIEEKEVVIEDEEDDNEPLFANSDSEEEEEEEEELSDVEGVDFENHDLYKDLPKKEGAKKRKRGSSGQNARKSRQKKLEKDLEEFEEKEKNEFSDAAGIIRMRAVSQLQFAQAEPTYRKQITDVFPEFFDNVNFEELDNDELLSRRRKMLNALTIHGVHNGTKNEYKLFSMIVAGIAKKVLDFPGDPTELHNMFQAKAANTIFKRLGKLRPDLNNFETSWMNHIMDVAVPACEYLFSASNSVAFENQLNEVFDSYMDPKEMMETEQEMANLVK